MKFSNLFNKVISETSQTKINNALYKHRDMRDANDIAKQRGDEFFNTAIARAKRKGNYITAKEGKDVSEGSEFFYYILEDATIDDYKIKITAAKTPIVKEVDSVVPVVIDFYYATGSMKESGGEKTTGFFWNKKTISRENLWLKNREDAERLSKFIMEKTGKFISWKLMNFIEKRKSDIESTDRYF